MVMKSYTRHLTAALLLTATPFGVVSCKKEAVAKAPAASSPEQSQSADAAPAEASVAGTPAWGFAARLPKNTEGFMAFYNTATLVEGLLKSKWFTKLKANKNFGEQIERAIAGLESDPKAADLLALLKEVTGKEIVLAFGEGTIQNFSHLPAVLAPVIRQAAKGAAEGTLGAQEVPASPGTFSQQSLWDLIMENESAEAKAAMYDAALSMDLPPLLAAVKAGGARKKLDEMFSNAVAGMNPALSKVVERGSYTEAGAEFQTLTFKIANIPVKPEIAAAEEREFTEIFGSVEKAKAFLARAKAKTFEVSWGWVGDYLVLSLGKDHSHVKLANGVDGVMGIPEVASLAAAWQAKKPFAFGYLSQSTSRALSGGSIFSVLASLLEASASATSIPVKPVAADLHKLAARSLEIWPNDADALTIAAWWEGGVQAECFGGAKPRAFDHRKPLTLTGLTGPATVFATASRVNEAERDKTFAFVEESCATLWESYRKNIKPSLPKEMAAQTGVAEAFGLPMVKALWQAVQDFRGALGAESIMMVNLDGAMPQLPEVPEKLKSAKIPRLLFASELKDAAKLSASWKGLGDLIASVISLSKAPVSPQPVEKKDGDLTSWGWTLPMDLGDVWPHAAVGGNRWYFGTSPTLTKTASTTMPAASGPAAGAMVRVNFSALWGYIAPLLPLSPTNTPDTLEAANGVLELLGSISELTATTGESGGTAHGRLHLRISDAR